MNKGVFSCRDRPAFAASPLWSFFAVLLLALALGLLVLLRAPFARATTVGPPRRDQTAESAAMLRAAKTVLTPLFRA